MSQHPREKMRRSKLRAKMHRPDVWQQDRQTLEPSFHLKNMLPSAASPSLLSPSSSSSPSPLFSGESSTTGSGVDNNVGSGDKGHVGTVVFKDNRSEIVRENKNFVKYYKAQNLVPEGEWDSFYGSLQLDLPSTFRIVEGTVHTEHIKTFVEEAIREFPSVVRKLEWYPGLAYEVNVSRAMLRSIESLREFHRMLVKQSEAGTIFRQEAVSMIPTIFLKVKSDSRVIDMCASPGSKTSQILERLHYHSSITNSTPTGVVLANDSDSKRGHMLIHHLHHLRSPSLVVTNHFAQIYPNIYIEPQVITTTTTTSTTTTTTSTSTTTSPTSPSSVTATQGTSHPPGLTTLDTTTITAKPSDTQITPDAHIKAASPNGPKGKVLMTFDNVLCDVPCSGDGTLRKSKLMWLQWHPSRALELHRLQLGILKRGLEMCEVGGRVVYSTCSFNPVENEAVVNAVMNISDGSIQLLDVRDELHSGVVARGGMREWSVQIKDHLYTTYSSLPDGVKKGGKYRTAFCDFSTEDCLEKDVMEDGSLKVKNACDFDISRCMRFFPHLNNTGGFFVAVFTKVKPITWLKVKMSMEGGSRYGEMKMSTPTPDATVNPVSTSVATVDTSGDNHIVDDQVEEDEYIGIRRGGQMKTDCYGLDEKEEADDNRGIVERMMRTNDAKDIHQGGDGCDNMNTIKGVTLGDIERRDGWEGDVSSLIRQHLSTQQLGPRWKKQKDFLSLKEYDGLMKNMRMEGVEAFWNKLGVPFGLSLPELNDFELFYVKYESALNPRRVSFASKYASAILQGVGNSCLKVVSAGCLVFEGRGSDHFRLTCSGAKWMTISKWGNNTLESDRIAYLDAESLLHLLGTTKLDSKLQQAKQLNTDRLNIETDTPQTTAKLPPVKSSEGRESITTPIDTKETSNDVEVSKHVTTNSADILDTTSKKGKAPGTVQTEFRHNIPNLPLACRLAVEKLATERPCLCICKLPEISQFVAIPSWRGILNLEVLVDSGTRFALQGLLELAISKKDAGFN